MAAEMSARAFENHNIEWAGNARGMSKQSRKDVEVEFDSDPALA